MALLVASRPPVPPGQITSTIYGHLREGRCNEAIQILEYELQSFPTSRAALSLLAFALFQSEDFSAAAALYEQLTRLYPDVPDYKLYQAQSLYKAGLHQDAAKLAVGLESQEQSLSLQIAIKYEQNDIAGCKRLLEKLPAGSSDGTLGAACLLYKEGNHEGARKLFTTAMNALGYQPELAYNIALCYYQVKQYGPALKHIAEIIERGVREHPELSVGAAADGAGVRSVGNSQVLKESALVEAFNLKAAIEYNMKNYEAAREAMADAPPRTEEELDPVTLHNSALFNMDSDPTGGFRKLSHLLQSPPFPPQTFCNILMLYCKPQHAFYDLAADVMADNADLVATNLSKEAQECLEAAMLSASAPEEAFQRFDVLAARHAEALRQLTKKVQDARVSRDTEALKRAVIAYEEALEAYIPVLMGQARIYWDMEHYSKVQAILQQSTDFCSEHEAWKLNSAHTFFMQGDGRFKEAISFYEPLVQGHLDNLLDVTAIVLANLCVCYIMTSQNDQAEALMRQVERQEEQQAAADPTKRSFHFCIVNLVIGTLYCVKGNYEFGIARIIKSMEPESKKLETDTWFYAKRCFLAFFEGVAKHMITLKDASYDELSNFLDAVERHGTEIHSSVAAGQQAYVQTVSEEARLLKKALLRLRH
ncbi:TPA: hypothetical protein ACH3X2_005245 [Trebouxia sp. C0005]